jgi:hypothetical protein
MGIHQLLPWESEEAEEAAWNAEFGDGGWLDAGHYDIVGNGYREERDPVHTDPQVEVDRFADYLPADFYDERFLQRLRVRFPEVDPPDRDCGMGQYAKMVDFVERFTLSNC